MMIPFDVNDAAARDRFLRRDFGEALTRLQAGARPRWGAMTAQQMVEHMAWICEVSTGRATVECPVPEEKRERYKAFLHNNTPMMREFRNPALAGGLPPLRHPGLPEARAAFAAEVGHFLEDQRAAQSGLHVHPVFGPLTVEEWSRAHFKHAYHHLLQFQLIEDPGGSP